MVVKINMLGLIFKLFLLSGFMAVVSGCSQKIVIRTLEPAEIDRAALTKRVSVAVFENDKIGLSNKIEANLIEQKIDNKNYFTIIGRKDFDKIISEQKIQNSGLVELSTAVQVGSLIGADAIISGSVGRVSANDTYYISERHRCVDKKCKEKIEYSVGCTKRVVGLSAEIRMVDVSKGDIIHAETANKASEWHHCRDDSDTLPSIEAAAQQLANKIADNFTYKITPHYRYFEVILLDKPDIEYDDKEEKLLEVSLEYIRQNRFDKAEKFLIDLIDETEQKSYVAFYNLGVIKEAVGNYSDAKKYYKMADDLTLEPVNEISRAYVRIEELIIKTGKAKEQLSN